MGTRQHDSRFLQDQVVAQVGAALVEEPVVNSITGGMKGKKLARFDLLPGDALWALAEHFGKGSVKYSDRNWERGTDYSLNFAAAQRHMWQWWGGEDTDAETGSSHLIAAMWHMSALFHFLATHPELDDRPVHGQS